MLPSPPSGLSFDIRDPGLTEMQELDAPGYPPRGRSGHTTVYKSS